VGTEQTTGISVSSSPLIAPPNEALSGERLLYERNITMKLTSLCQVLSIQLCIKWYLNFILAVGTPVLTGHAEPVLAPPRRSDPGYRIRLAHEATSDPRPSQAQGIWPSAPSATNRKCEENTIKGNISLRGLEAGPKGSLEYALFTFAGRHDRRDVPTPIYSSSLPLIPAFAAPPWSFCHNIVSTTKSIEVATQRWLCVLFDSVVPRHSSLDPDRRPCGGNPRM